METIKLIVGFTKTQMIYHFFDNHRDGAYSTLYISQYLYENFDLPEDKPLWQLNNEVSSLFSTFYDESNTRQTNFIRYQDPSSNRKKFLYEFEENDDVFIPKAFQDIFPPRTQQFNILPKQQEYKEDAGTLKIEQLALDLEENIKSLQNATLTISLEDSTNQTESPLIKDIKNADILKSYNDNPVQYSIEQLISLIPADCTEMIYKKYVNEKTYKIIISEA